MFDLRRRRYLPDRSFPGERDGTEYTRASVCQPDFQSLWNRNYIDSIEIYAAEKLGVENRGKYYEGAGALRDMIQNHLMQLMGFVAMEAPSAFDPT